MKNILVLIILFSSVTLFSQKIKFEKVIKAKNTDSKEVLFDRMSSRLIEFIGGQNKYDKNIIHSDKKLGVIKFKHRLEYNPKGNRSDDGFVNYNVNVFFKNGRFKIILKDLTHVGKGISLYEITEDKEYPHKKTNYLRFRKKSWREIKEFLNNEVPKTISSIEKFILTPIEQEKDW